MKRAKSNFIWAAALVLHPFVQLGAQGTASVTPDRVRITIPVGRSTAAQWSWHDQATPDNEGEYAWQARIGDQYSVGFQLFKFPGSAPASGSFEDLLRAGQSDVAEIIPAAPNASREPRPPSGGRVIQGIRPHLSGERDQLIVELTDKNMIARIFATRPRVVLLETVSPYSKYQAMKVPIHYGDPAGAQDLGNFNALAIPTRSAGTCMPGKSRESSDVRIPTIFELVMTSSEPGRRREMSIMVDTTGRVMGYQEIDFASTGLLSSHGDAILARIDPNGGVHGTRVQSKTVMPDSVLNQLDTTRLRRLQESGITKSQGEPLDAGEQRRVLELAEWLRRRCPA
jgi:hypothetical protein